MCNEKISFIKCNIDNIHYVEEILNDVLDWLDSIKVEQWEREHIKWSHLSKSYVPEDFILCLVDGEVAGCMAVVDYDPYFWDGCVKGDALYIHKLAVKRQFSGLGLSTAMLNYVKDNCIKNNISLMRLDTHCQRDKLKLLYEEFGFKPICEKSFYDGEYDAILYEMKV